MGSPDLQGEGTGPAGGTRPAGGYSVPEVPRSRIGVGPGLGQGGVRPVGRAEARCTGTTAVLLTYIRR